MKIRHGGNTAISRNEMDLAYDHSELTHGEMKGGGIPDPEFYLRRDNEMGHVDLLGNVPGLEI